MRKISFQKPNARHCLIIVSISATVSSLILATYTLSLQTAKASEGIGGGFLRILIFPSIGSSICASFAYLIKSLRTELFLLALIFLMSVFILLIPIVWLFL